RLDEAEALCRRAMELRPEYSQAPSVLGYVQLMRGQAEESRRSLTRYAELAGVVAEMRHYTEALVERTLGHAATSPAARPASGSRWGSQQALLCAEIGAWRGETDAAFGWLDKGVAADDPSMASLKIDPLLASLHSDRRWNPLLLKVGLPAD